MYCYRFVFNFQDYCFQYHKQVFQLCARHTCTSGAVYLDSSDYVKASDYL